MARQTFSADMSWLLGDAPPKRGRLKERIASALGWKVAEVSSFSLQSLRDILRKDHPALAKECDEAIRSGKYLLDIL